MNIKARYFNNSPVVQCWEINCAVKEDLQHTVMPSPYPQIIFPLKGSINIQGIARSISEPFVSTILEDHKKIRLAQGALVFGVHMEAIAASALFKISPSELPRNANLIKDVFQPIYYSRLRELLLRAKAFEERVDAVNNFIHGHVDLLKIKNREVMQYLLHKMNNEKNFCLKNNIKKTGYSERWIQKIHMQMIGTTPTELKRIIRFNLLLNRLYSTSSESFTQICIDAGYYDQAHAIKDFKEFAGYTPKIFAQTQPILNKVVNYY